ncbi:MAG: hypothetical protein U0166_19900 [Acidobacteriota bacterium]
MGAYKSRYSVYAKNNYDDPSQQVGTDNDHSVVLTGQGIIQVNQQRGTQSGYRVTREVEVTVKISKTTTYDGSVHERPRLRIAEQQPVPRRPVRWRRGDHQQRPGHGDPVVREPSPSRSKERTKC